MAESDKIRNSDLFSEDTFVEEIRKAREFLRYLTQIENGMRALAAASGRQVDAIPLNSVSNAQALSQALDRINQIERSLLDIQRQRTATNTRIAADEERLAALRARNAAQQQLNEDRLRRSRLQTEAAERRATQQQERANQRLREQSGLLGQVEENIRRLNSLQRQANTPAQLERINRLLARQVELQRELRGSATSSSSSSSGGRSGFFGAFSDAMTPAMTRAAFFGNLAANAVKSATMAIIGFGKEAVQAAAKAEGITKAFNQLGKPGLLDELREATKGTVNDLTLMTTAVKASNFKLPLDQLSKLLQFAQMRARDTGESVEYLTESIVLGISRKSVPILDNLGLSATELQNEFKKTGDFAAAVGNIIDTELGKAGDRALTTADKLDRLNVFWDNLKVGVGEFLIGRGNEMLDWWDTLTGKISAAKEEADDWRERFVRIGQEAGGMRVSDVEGAAQRRIEKEGITDEKEKLRIRKEQYRTELDFLKLGVEKAQQDRDAAPEGSDLQRTQRGIVDSYLEQLRVLTDAYKRLDSQGSAAAGSFGANLNSNFELEKIRANARAEQRKKSAEEEIKDSEAFAIELADIETELKAKLADIERRKAIEDANFRRRDIELGTGAAEEKAAKLQELDNNLAHTLENISEQLRLDLLGVEDKKLEDLIAAAEERAQFADQKFRQERDKEKARAEQAVKDQQLAQQKQFEGYLQTIEHLRKTGRISEEEYQRREIALLRDHLQQRADVILDASAKEIEKIEADFEAGILTREEYEARKRKEIEDAGKEVLAMQTDLGEKELALQRSILERRIELVEQFNQAIADGLDKRFELQQKAAEREGKLIEDQVAVQRDLFARGLDNNLDYEERRRAENQEKQAEIEERKRKAEEAQQLASLFLDILKGYAKDGDINATAKALAQTLAAKGISDAIAGSAYEGTPDTGAAGDGDSKGGKLWMLHPHEAVIPRKRNEEAPGLAQAWIDGNLGDYFRNVYLPQYAASTINDDAPRHGGGSGLASNDGVISELRQLRETVKNKKESMWTRDAIGQLVQDEVQSGRRRRIIHSKRRI